ncbi:putative T7SS-secreted protein [Phaeacidiphilus oryzae]|uniref:putative T7SS-secreted protein n=1 Tax=Phaeacidiphilus oryzae TaxID=348818 RepID=UPI000ABA11F8|nr:hypothetical protein [Phaeacidiphilus oryzae]
MGLGDLINSVGDGLEHAAQGVEHGAGSLVDGAAHLAGDGLNAVGLHSAAQSVDEFGDHVADRLGASVAEAELGESDDPKDLLHGDAGAIGRTAQALRRFHEGFENAFQALSRLETGDWQGQAAQAFQAKYLEHPKRWADAADACARAALALESYARTVTWAQGQARQAITQYAAAQKLTDGHNQQVEAYNQKAIAWNYGVQHHLAPPPGTEKPLPPPSEDPGAPGRAQARQLLDAARRQRDAAAEDAARALAAATATAPREPSFLERMYDDGHDLVQDANTELLHFTGGIAKGAVGIVDFARSLNPLDPYNITHPASYLDGLSTTAAGLVHAADHPTVLLKSLVGSGWTTDPAQALGNLIPNIALTVATDGAGAAEGAGADVAANAGERSAVRAGEDAAVNGARDLATTNATADSSQAAALHATDEGAQGSFARATAQLDGARPNLASADAGAAQGVDAAGSGLGKVPEVQTPNLDVADATARESMQDASTGLDHVADAKPPNLDGMTDSPGPETEPSRIARALEPDRYPSFTDESAALEKEGDAGADLTQAEKSLNELKGPRRSDDAGNPSGAPQPPPRRLAITDNSPQTARALAELGQVPAEIFNKVSAYLAEIPGGGMSIGDAPLTQLPGGEVLTGAPRGWPEGSSWNDVAGVYIPGSRRLLINSGGASASGSVPIHEFGHAADDALGNLSAGADFAEVQGRMQSAMSDTSTWNSYYDHPSELWAEGFAAWTQGGDSMLHLTAGNADAAEILKGYYDGILR